MRSYHRLYGGLFLHGAGVGPMKGCSSIDTIRNVRKLKRSLVVTSKTRLDALWIYPLQYTSFRPFLHLQRDCFCLVDPTSRVCLLHIYMGSFKVGSMDCKWLEDCSSYKRLQCGLPRLWLLHPGVGNLRYWFPSLTGQCFPRGNPLLYAWKEACESIFIGYCQQDACGYQPRSSQCSLARIRQQTHSL